MLDLAGIVNDSIVDGPGIRMTIFAQGCPHHCRGCHNPETWAFGCGTPMEEEHIVDIVATNPLCRGVTFSGGEPFAQAEGFSKLAQLLKDRGYEVASYSGYTFEHLLNGTQAQQKLLQTIFFLPYVTNSIAIGMVFSAMFNIIGLRPSGIEADSWGIINSVIMFFGGEPINWINAGSDYWSNIVVMIVYIVWNALPFKILVLLGGLQGINKQYYEAARVDGTSRGRVLTKITVPLLSPMIAYVVITGFIGGFKEYSSIVGIFGDTMGPVHDARRLNTMVGFIYDSLGTNSHGTASAAALILFGIILVVTMINLQVSKKRVHY